MGVRGPNNVGRTVQTDPALLHCALAITERKKCWLKRLTGFKLRANGRNNSQRYPQQCWELLANKVASVSMGLKVDQFQTLRNNTQHVT